MSKHTPGPWVWDKADLSFRSADGEELIIALGCEGIAEDVWNGRITWEEFAPSDADARLIDAAPDLLEVLEKVQAWMNGGVDDELAYEIDLALTKAKGE